jgi:hypothetical protein
VGVSSDEEGDEPNDEEGVSSDEEGVEKVRNDQLRTRIMLVAKRRTRVVVVVLRLTVS